MKMQNVQKANMNYVPDAKIKHKWNSKKGGNYESEFIGGIVSAPILKPV